MNIKFPPLVNVEGTFDAVRTFGSQTLVIETTVKGRMATITMNRNEAEWLVENLRGAGIGAKEPAAPTPAPAAPAFSVGAVRLPVKK